MIGEAQESRNSWQEPESFDRPSFLDLISRLGAHSVYFPHAMVKSLTEIGLPTRMADNGNGIRIEDEVIETVEPEWGEPGIYPMSVLALVFRLAVGRDPKTDMTGRGFQLSDILNQLARYWRLEERY